MAASCSAQAKKTIFVQCDVLIHKDEKQLGLQLQIKGLGGRDGEMRG